MINILLVEDHNIVRDGIRALLSSDPQLTIVGEAESGTKALTMLSQGLVADIILSDIHMPDLSGLELIEKLRIKKHAAKIIIMSMSDSDRYVVEAFNAGATGYILKNVSADELIFAIKHIFLDGRYICSELAIRFLDRLIFISGNSKSNKEVEELTERDMEILQHISDGYTNQEIADKMFTSKRTIETNRQILIEKLNAKNTAHLIKMCMSMGIVK